MKKWMLSFTLLSLMAAASCNHALAYAKAPSPPSFHDVSGSFAQEAVVRLAGKGIVNGDEQGAFLPKDPVTRAEFTAMLLRMLELQPVHNDLQAFRDVDESAWYYGYIHAWVNLSLVEGNGYLFEPNRMINRQEAAVMVMRALKQTDGYTGHLEGVYGDAWQIASWARSAIARSTDAGLLTGDRGKFRPLDLMTREEAAALLDRALTAGDVSAAVEAGRKASDATIRMGWLYNGTASQYIAYAKRAELDVLVPRWYFLEPSGALTDHTDDRLLQWSRSSGTKVWAMVGNRGNAESTHQLLSSADKQKAFISALRGYVNKYDLDGINLDFENVRPEDRAGLTAFVASLSTEMHKANAVLSVDVSPDLNTDWTAAFDYAALGHYADYIVLMGYDQHWSGSPKAGSVSSQPWLSGAVNKLLTQVPASKSILAAPLYTRDWQLGPAVTSQDISLVEQGNRIRQRRAQLAWDEVMGQYTASYTLSGNAHRIWTEDARSLSLKHAIGASRGLAGYAYWYMGGETADVWPAISNALQFTDYRFKL
ncbi:S-layer homology domain-containing protein [Paenibacillus sp. FSL M8-0334]|uniref:S-layer homology domain-containing protein n=1 Tax=Paenibacillus sp. FSL M8-0334 TaxID=2921623 RepID=UPI0030FB4AC9